MVRASVTLNHPHAAATARLKPDKKLYFEAHIAFENTREEVSSFAAQHNLHLSANRMKRGERSVIMATLRQETPPQNAVAFYSDLDKIYLEALAAGLNVDKKRVAEYALFDDSVEHDRNWTA